MPATLQDVRETLSLTTGAQNLVQPIINRMLMEYVRKYTPLRRVLPREAWMTNTYFFNRRNKYPVAQMVQEAPPLTGAGSVTPTDSNFVQINFPIKHFQVNMDLSNFAIQVARVNGNLVDLELAGAAEAMVYREEMEHLYGSAGASLNTLRPGWDSFDLMLTSKVDAGGALLTMALMDQMIDKVKGVLSDELGSRFFFLASPPMVSQINSLFITYARYMKDMTIFTRDNAGIPGAPVVDNTFDAGIDVISYRGIPIVESSFVSSIGTMSTIAATDTGAVSGGQLANSAYNYVVECVTDYGITVASNEVAVTPTAGHGITVTWTPPTIVDVFGNTRTNLYYRIFRTAAAAASGTETLYAVVSALDNTDTPIASFLDSGIPIVPSVTPTAYATTVLTSGAASIPDGITFPRIQVSPNVVEDLWLLPRDPDFCCVPVVNELTTKLLAPVNARTQQLAVIGDEVLALRAPAFGAKLCRVRSK